MEDNKRLILGFLLIFIVMIIFQYYTVSQTRSSKITEETAVTEDTTRMVKKDTIEKKEEKEKKKKSLAEKMAGESKEKEDREPVRQPDTDLITALTPEEDTAQNDRQVIVETKLQRLYMNTMGATVDSIYLKEYDVTFSPHNNQNPLLSSSIIRGSSRFSLDSVPFKYVTERAEDYKKITFMYREESLEVKKEYTFINNSYLIVLNCSPEGEYIHKVHTFDTGEDLPRENRYSGVIYSAAKKPNTVYKGDLFKGEDKDISGTIDWVGYKTKYFFSGVVPERYLTEFSIEKSEVNPLINIRDDDSVRVYLGPLKYTTLTSVKEGFENAIYFGWTFIRPVSKIIFNFILFLRQFIDNMGVVIILFTFIMVLILSPITLTSFKSMHRMQEIQPKMQELRSKYKDDPQRMNKEMMELYREHGVNPFSSCLPLFLQFPIFFALYSVLNSTIELKGAPFILWIQDLSQKDPYYILPILMGVSMFLQQRFFSPSAKSDQQKIFSFIMPVVITFVFLTFPSGLALYWFTYNLLMIFVQMYIRKQA